MYIVLLTAKIKHRIKWFRCYLEQIMRATLMQANQNPSVLSAEIRSFRIQ